MTRAMPIRASSGTLRAAEDPRLGHTPAVCKKSYIHPRLLEDFAANTLSLPHTRATDLTVEAMRKVERNVAHYLAR